MTSHTPGGECIADEKVRCATLTAAQLNFQPGIALTIPSLAPLHLPFSLRFKFVAAFEGVIRVRIKCWSGVGPIGIPGGPCRPWLRADKV